MDRKIAHTTLPDGKIVSTVRLPFLHRGGLYETMVFPGGDQWGELDMARYNSEMAAEAGHKAMVAKWEAGTPEETTSCDDPLTDLLGAIFSGLAGETEQEN